MPWKIELLVIRFSSFGFCFFLITFLFVGRVSKGRLYPQIFNWTAIMKIFNESGEKLSYNGLGGGQSRNLSRMITHSLSLRPFVLMAVVGNKGIGKSLLGKHFRNKGIGEISPKKIVVIDDDNMAVDFLWFFRRWKAIPCSGVDELQPFMKYCKKKSVLVYIKSNPESRISRADIVVRLITGEQKRQQRLIKRDGLEKGTWEFIKTQKYSSQIKIDFDYIMTAII